MPFYFPVIKHVVHQLSEFFFTFFFQWLSFVQDKIPNNLKVF